MGQYKAKELFKELANPDAAQLANFVNEYATEHLAVSAVRIESGASVQNVGKVLRFPYGGERKAG